VEKSKEVWPRILVGIPLPQYMNTMPFVAFWNIAKRGWPIIEGVPQDRCDVQRNIFARIAAKSPATHLCLLDADHVHRQDIVDRFARHVIADPGKMVVCGFQYRRCPPYNPCVYVQRGDEYYWLHERPADELLEVQGVSAASILINTDVFRSVAAPWWRYTYDHVEEDVYPGTDGWFSKLMRDSGIRMYCDTSVTSPHLDHRMGVTEETYLAYCEFEKDVKLREHDGVVYPDIKTRIEV